MKATLLLTIAVFIAVAVSAKDTRGIGLLREAEYRELLAHKSFSTIRELLSQDRVKCNPSLRDVYAGIRKDLEVILRNEADTSLTGHEVGIEMLLNDPSIANCPTGGAEMATAYFELKTDVVRACYGYPILLYKKTDLDKIRAFREEISKRFIPGYTPKYRDAQKILMAARVMSGKQIADPKLKSEYDAAIAFNREEDAFCRLQMLLAHYGESLDGFQTSFEESQALESPDPAVRAKAIEDEFKRIKAYQMEEQANCEIVLGDEDIRHQEGHAESRYVGVHEHVIRPGHGYPGRLEPYGATPELKAKMSQFALTAGVFRRDNTPDEYLRTTRNRPPDRLPYLLYSPKRGTQPVPMVVYFGGTGEQGEDLMKQFGQTVIFSKVTSEAFQKLHPCYLFAPLMPTGTTMRSAQPAGTASKLADLTCDAMYAVIASLKSPCVDTNRLYVTGLSWGGVAAFELPCSYPGRFAASVPISCIQIPNRIPKDHPGNYWMIHNENDYRTEKHLQAISEVAEIVRAGGGDFRRSTYPDKGHDAWSKAWQEDAVWEWMFSKTTEGGSSPKVSIAGKDVRARSAGFSVITAAKCTASVPGKDDGHGPERVVDGLDATAYVSVHPVSRGDWLEIEFPEKAAGAFSLFSGYKDGKGCLVDAAVEVMQGNGKWLRIGAFSKKNGIARFMLRTPSSRIRIVYHGARPTTMVIRKLAWDGN